MLNGNIKLWVRKLQVFRKFMIKFKIYFLSVEVETEWDFVNGNNSELLKLVAEHKSYKLIYWKLWGLINVYKCPKCDQYFQVTSSLTDTGLEK